MTLTAAGRAYLELLERSHAPNTMRTYYARMRTLEAAFGSTPLDEIDATRLVEWGLSHPVKPGTLRKLMQLLEALYDQAGLPSPVSQASKRIFSAASRTREHRCEERGELAHPVAAEEMGPLLEALPGPERDHVLLSYEAGLRPSEARGLRFGSIVWGRGTEDASRRLLVREQRYDDGTACALTKTGEERVVLISRRLRAFLLERYLAAGQDDSAYVLEERRGTTLRDNLAAACLECGIAPHRPKDFRDTYASLLLTEGVQLQWISHQLGHSDTRVTQRHYARWMTESYRQPWSVPEGYNPSDRLAQLDGWHSSTRAVPVADVSV